MEAEPGLDITVLAGNCDTEMDLSKRWPVRSPSTREVLRGQKEPSRSINDTTGADQRVEARVLAWLPVAWVNLAIGL